MIVGQKTNIYDFTAFVAAFQQAAKGVVYIQSQMALGTGWMITDELLAVPEYVASASESGPEKITGFFGDDLSGSNPVEFIPLPFTTTKDIATESKVSLYRATLPATGRALSLYLDKLYEHDDAFILQYTEGVRTLKISAGNLLSISEDTIQYDADTMSGSGGSPVLNGAAQVIGMHTRKYFKASEESATEQQSAQAGNNGGPCLLAIINQLRARPEWEEIAEFHKIIGVQSEQQEKDLQETIQRERSVKGISDVENYSLLLNSALQWHIDSAGLSEDEGTQLKPYVIDAHPGKWTMKLEDRQRIIGRAGSFNMLKNAHNQIKNTTAGDRVIANILKGPPYQPADIPEADLPYWLQAVRWFGNTIEGLPQPTDISLALEQKRHRSRLRVVAGPDFRGRKEELATIGKWYNEKDKGPLLITGIGGMGKSSLISKFILDLPGDSVFFWLDFDRADLSPDDAESVLDKISEQAFVQIAGFRKKTGWPSTDWTINTQELAKEIAQLLPPGKKQLMVLDGFEVAQHVKKYNEIWKVLEDLLENLPNLKVIVSGRSTVKSLQLKNLDAVPLVLKGMDAESAAGWLDAHNIKDKHIVDEVLRISKGIPLVLRLAATLVEKGGDVQQLPKTLPENMVEGYLYQRILDRVIDPVIHPLAKDVLVVRRLTVPILDEVFKKSLPEGLTATDVFERLMNEMSLVNEMDSAASIALNEDAGVLYLRPEVRSATLKLLEQDNPEQVKTIHSNAIKWYAGQDMNLVNRAELIYHYLQLGEIDKAGALWQDDCILPLAGAELDFGERNKASAKWLSEHIQRSSAAVSVETWEQDAVKRIIEAIQRGREEIVASILEEKKERSANSPLTAYDALVLLQQRDHKKLEQLLDSRIPAGGTVAQPLLILRALNAWYSGNIENADAYLSELEKSFGKNDTEPWTSTRLLARAARINLCVLVDKEVQVAEIFRSTGGDMKLKSMVGRFLTPADVVMPMLGNELNIMNMVQESYTELLQVPGSTSDLAAFRSQLFMKRNKLTGFIITPEQAQDIDLAGKEWRSRFEDRLSKETSLPKDLAEPILKLATGGFKKWLLASQDLFLSKAVQYQGSEISISNELSRLAILRSIAGLRGEQLSFYGTSDYYRSNGTDMFILEAIKNSSRIYSIKLPVTDATIKTALDVLYLENNKSLFLQDLLTSPQGSVSKATGGREQTRKLLPFKQLMSMLERPELFSTMLQILGPDPIEVLCRQVMGLPEDFEI